MQRIFNKNLQHKLFRPQSHLSLLQASQRSIFLRGTGLDRDKYDKEQAEKFDRLTYIKNYLLTKEDLTDSQRFELESERNRLIDEVSKSSKEKETTDGEVELDTAKLKDMFDEMTEIDSDPNSKRAQAYYKNMQEQARNV